MAWKRGSSHDQNLALTVLYVSSSRVYLTAGVTRERALLWSHPSPSAVPKTPAFIP